MAISLGMHSPKIDAVRPLRTAKGRREQQRFLIEGPTLLAEAFLSGIQPEAVYATQEELEKTRFPEDFNAPIYIVPERAMARLSELETPPGIVAILPTRLLPLERVLAGGRPIALLAGVADPGNAGTLLRSAEIFGISGAIFAADGIEPYNPKVVRASMGAIFRQSLASATSSDLTAAARAHGYRIVATSRNGVHLPQFHFPQRPIIAVGNERHGVAAWLPTWDDEVSIPHVGNGESLNAAVAGSIIFYAFSQYAGNPVEVS